MEKKRDSKNLITIIHEGIRETIYQTILKVVQEATEQELKYAETKGYQRPFDRFDQAGAKSSHRRSKIF